MEIPNHVPILLLDEVSSTNDYLKQLSLSSKIEEGTVVLAQYQEKGKGQREKIWESEKGKNLLFSMYLDTTRKGNPFVINMMVSLAVCSVLEKFGITQNVSIKWPNDVLVGGEKIAGILIENTIGSKQTTKTFIGVGLNVNQKKFTNMSRKATSLINILGSSTDILELADALRNAIWSDFQKGKWRLVLENYNQKLYGKGAVGLFSFTHQKSDLVHFSVDMDGKLNVEFSNGEKSCYQHGEVTYLI